MRAIIHIGTEKTGSTTIQSFLETNARRLSSRGTEVVFPRGYEASRPFVTWSVPSRERHPEFLRAGLPGVAEQNAWKERFHREFRSYMEKKGKRCGHFLFSSEHFHSRLSNDNKVRRFKKLLDEFFDDYKIVVYLRRQDVVARSRFSTSLRTGNVPKVLLHGNSESTYYDYHGLLTRWAEAFGRDNLDARRFGGRYFVEGDLLADFCEACEIPGSSGLRRPHEKNRALSAIAQAALLEFNIHFPRGGGNRGGEFHRILRRHCEEYLMEQYPGPCLMPSRAEAEAFYRQFEEGNERMYEEFFGGERIFDNDFSKYPESAMDPLGVPGHREALVAALEDFERHYVEAKGSSAGVRPRLLRQWLSKLRRITEKDATGD